MGTGSTKRAPFSSQSARTRGIMPKTVVTAVLILLVTIGAAANADAQSDNTGNPSILKAVQDLQQSVDALSSQVNNISAQGTNVTSQLNSIMTKLTSITTQLDAISAPPATIATSALGLHHAEHQQFQRN